MAALINATRFPHELAIERRIARFGPRRLKSVKLNAEDWTHREENIRNLMGERLRRPLIAIPILTLFRLLIQTSRCS